MKTTGAVPVREDTTACPAPPARRRIALRPARGRVGVLVRPRALIVCMALLAALVALVLHALTNGDAGVSVAGAIRAATGGGDSYERLIVVTLRLPRILVALLVGAALGVAGAILQRLTRNPLGSPDILGLATGAATGAVVQIVHFGGGTYAIATAALVGCLLTGLAIHLLAGRGAAQGQRFILVGIGVTAMLSSINTWLLTRAELDAAQLAQTWIVGSLNNRDWQQVRIAAVAVLVLVALALARSRDLDMLALGDETAAALGVRVARTRLFLMVLAVALTAVGVYAAGPIGFVALAAPQIARRLTGGTGTGIIAAALTGAALLLAADIVAQRLFAPTQLPAGVVTASLGGCYLAWLLAAEWRRGRG